MTKQLFIATPKDIRRFDKYIDPMEVFEELKSQRYTFNTFNEISPSFMLYCPIRDGILNGGFFMTIHEKGMRLGGLHFSEDESLELTSMLCIYFGLEKIPKRSVFSHYPDPHVLLTEATKVSLVRKVCTGLDITPIEVEQH